MSPSLGDINASSHFFLFNDFRKECRWVLEERRKSKPKTNVGSENAF